METKYITFKSILEALDRFSIAKSKCHMYKHKRNLAFSLNLNHPNIKGDNLHYMLDILESLPRVYSEVHFDHDNDNLLFNDLKLINTVANMPDIIINTADKNLGFTINHLDWYIQEYKRQLSDNDVYEKLPLEQLSNILSLGKNDLLLLYNKYANNENLRGY